MNVQDINLSLPHGVVVLDPATGLPAVPLAQGLTRAQLDAAPVGVTALARVSKTLAR